MLLDVRSCHIASKSDSEKSDAKIERNHEEGKKENEWYQLKIRLYGSMKKLSVSKGRWTSGYLVDQDSDTRNSKNRPRPQYLTFI